MIDQSASPEPSVHRILVVTEEAAVTDDLLRVIRRSAEGRACQFRVVIPNPARAEAPLRHPERHEKAAQAEAALRRLVPALEEAAGGQVVASVSVRHDPMDVMEDVLFNEPVDEVVLAVHGSAFAAWLHQDLRRRLEHQHHVRVVEVGERPPA